MPSPKKALSIRAPWWWFILHCGKDIENRDWPSSFRGTVYVHASKWYVNRDVVADLWSMDSQIESLRERRFALEQGQHPYSYLKPFGGCIVGTVEIVDCVRESTSPWFFGNYGFVLQNPAAFTTPVPCKGALGFFTVPDDCKHCGQRIELWQTTNGKFLGLNLPQVPQTRETEHAEPHWPECPGRRDAVPASTPQPGTFAAQDRVRSATMLRDRTDARLVVMLFDDEDFAFAYRNDVTGNDVQHELITAANHIRRTLEAKHG